MITVSSMKVNKRNGKLKKNIRITTSLLFTLRSKISTYCIFSVLKLCILDSKFCLSKILNNGS